MQLGIFSRTRALHLDIRRSDAIRAVMEASCNQITIASPSNLRP
jgi:hypothetical protein